MNFFPLFAILLIIPVIGCAASDVSPSVKGQLKPQEVFLNIHGIVIKDKKIRLQVMSNGCTKAESFKLIWKEDNLTVERLKPDYCRRVPHKVWLEFKIPAQVKKFSVANKFEY